MAAVLAAVTLSAQERQTLGKEAGLGAILARDFRRGATTLENPAFNQYIERVGSKLSAQLGPNQPKYTFGLVADESVGRNPRHEAVSFPGGYIFVPAGLVLMAADGKEFVERIAHAMAHIAGERKWQVPNTQTPNQATIPVIFLGGKFGLGGDDDKLLLPLGFRKTMQEREIAADELTDQIMAGSSADPSSSEDEFLKMRTEVRRIVADRAPRPPSLRSPH